jgi:hypothetical protein
MNIYSDRRLKSWKYRGDDGKFMWFDKSHFTCRVNLLTGKVKIFNNKRNH